MTTPKQRRCAMTEHKKRRVSVVRFEGGESVEAIDLPAHESAYDKAYMGLVRNMDLERFYVREDWREEEQWADLVRVEGGAR